MPMVFPQEGPGFGSAALDALRGLGLHNASDDGSMQKLNKNRLTEGNELSVPTGAVPSPYPMSLRMLQLLEQQKRPTMPEPNMP